MPDLTPPAWATDTALTVGAALGFTATIRAYGRNLMHGTVMHKVTMTDGEGLRAVVHYYPGKVVVMDLDADREAVGATLDEALRGEWTPIVEAA